MPPGATAAAAGVVLLLIAAVIPLDLAGSGSSASDLGLLPSLLGFGFVGIVVTRNQPRHPIGWLLLGVAACFALTSDASAYSVLAYRHHDGLPLGWLAVLLQPAWAPGIMLSGLSVLLFPDGHIASRRLRVVVWAFVAVGVAWLAGAYAIAAAAILHHHVHVEPSGDLTAVDHPTGIASYWGAIQVVFFPLLAVSWLLWLVAQVPQYRRATGERRLQLKWLLSGASVFVVCGLLSVTQGGTHSRLAEIAATIGTIGLVALPLSIGIGILRFRLYEIDRLISRTLAYAILSATLAAVFLGTVALTTQALPFSSPVGVAASTLATAALFNPVRRRAQRLVDRRFNRARYDAELIVAAFTTRLRDAVDLDTVRGELVRAVEQAVEPVHTSVWIRPGSGEASRP